MLSVVIYNNMLIFIDILFQYWSVRNHVYRPLWDSESYGSVWGCTNLMNNVKAYTGQQTTSYIPWRCFAGSNLPKISRTFKDVKICLFSREVFILWPRATASSCSSMCLMTLLKLQLLSAMLCLCCLLQKFQWMFCERSLWLLTLQ